MSDYKIPAELRPWVEATAPTLTAADWRWCEAVVAAGSTQAQATVGRHFTLDEARALLAFGPCVEWEGPRNTHGYGVVRVRGMRSRVMAHRMAYEILVGPIPDGLVIDHLCRNRACVNPDHMEAVTNRENVLRGVGPSAQSARKERCRRGHPIDTTGDVYTTPSGERQCRICKRERNKTDRARARGRSRSSNRRQSPTSTGCLTPTQRDLLRQLPVAPSDGKRCTGSRLNTAMALARRGLARQIADRHYVVTDKGRDLLGREVARVLGGDS